MALRLTTRPIPLARLVSLQQIRSFSIDSPVGEESRFYPVYVHHLSKVVLEHFQENYSPWIIEKKLENGLKFNSDGTFVLQFPKSKGRIWTSYDGGKKQHWLCVYKDGTLERFLMKDVMERGGISETAINATVRASVDQLVSKVDFWEKGK